MRPGFLFLTALMLIACISLAQTPDTIHVPVIRKKIPPKPEHRWGDGGIGFGLDYGGLIGVKATFYPIKYMGIFGAAGWEYIGIGWNAGVLGRLIAADGTHGARPYMKVMYGVNAVTTVSGLGGYDKMFYGFTVGLGLEARFGRRKASGINLDLNFPFRTPDYFLQVSNMHNNPQIKMTSSTIPVTVSIGYNVEFQ
jgi:hypothetical protein